ncbi:hypothetical protein [Desulfobulbus sp.]|uniref:zinc ribbon-containing (seleno)protein DG n=1 Tax=Desulfobulbus sp. TaxID=895 RepID=UPI00286F7B35|nr:hypothetical protein [Desulfobulbus sp.]
MPIDPEYNYCPQCGDEYRPEVRNCAECGVALVGGEVLLAGQNQRSASLAEIGPLEPVIAVHKGPVLQVKALQAYLREKGLPSRIVKENDGACGCRGPEVLLQVRETDQAETMAAMAQEYRENTSLSDHDTRFVGAVYDAGAAEAVCPACGCRFAPDSTECPDCGLCFA